MYAHAIDAIFQDGFDPGFSIQTPDIVVAPGESATYCYYFRTPNTGAMGIRKWTSSMGDGMAHLILYTTYDTSWNPAERVPAGTVTQSPCGLDGSGFIAWVYAAHNANQQLVVPADDGSGVPLGIKVLADQPAFVQMYVSNPGGAPVTTSAVLRAEALVGPYTASATYMAVNTNLSIPPGANGYSATQTCALPAGAKFWWLSTRTHKYATDSRIVDAATPQVVSTDWAHPSEAGFASPGFHQFAPGGLSYACTYDNPGSTTISAGENEAANEACVGIGYFFPAARPALCVNSTGPL